MDINRSAWVRRNKFVTLKVPLSHFLLQVIQVILKAFCFRELFCIAFRVTGGPLLVNNVQVGIVSWSVKPCGVPPFPGVFTDVSRYVDWIENKTGIDFSLNIFLQSIE